MPYVKQEWTDEAPSSTPIEYKISQDADGDIAANATIEIVTPVSPGSPVNAARLNHMEEGIETAQETADEALDTAETAAIVAAAAIPKNLATAIGQLLYSTASGIWAALIKPTVTAILQMTSSGVPSWRPIKQIVQIQVTAETTEVDTTSIAYFFVPSTMDGMNLVRAQAMVLTAGTTNPTTIQIRNLTKYASNDALSTAISIASGGTVGTVGAVNASYDDVSTNDKMKVYVTSNSTTKPKGLFVILEYQLP